MPFRVPRVPIFSKDRSGGESRPIRDTPNQSRCEELSTYLDAYAFRQRLGRGAFGQVLLAEADPDTTSGRRRRRREHNLVAIKVIRRTKFAKDSTQALALAEVENLRRISATGSPFFTQLRETFYDAHNLYIVTDFLCGGTLRDELNRLHRVGRLMTYERIILVMAQLVEATAQLHELRIIHRDIKPENVLLDACGNIVLADFGLSRWFEIGSEDPEVEQRNAMDLTCHSRLSIFKRRRDSALSNGRVTEETDKASTRAIKSCLTDTGCGTLEYAAPEMHRGEPYSFAADIYSLGVILYELLFDRLPLYPPSGSSSGESCETDPYWFFRLDHPRFYRRTLTLATVELLTSFLTLDPEKRVTIASLRVNPFFSGVHWPTLAKRAYALPLSHAPPIRPYNMSFTINPGALVDPMALRVDGPETSLEAAYEGSTRMKLKRRPDDPCDWKSMAKLSVRIASGRVLRVLGAQSSRGDWVTTREWARDVNREHEHYESLRKILDSRRRLRTEAILSQQKEMTPKDDGRDTEEQGGKCECLSTIADSGCDKSTGINPHRTLRRITTRIPPRSRLEDILPHTQRAGTDHLRRCEDRETDSDDPKRISKITFEPGIIRPKHSHADLPPLSTHLSPSSPEQESCKSLVIPNFPWDTPISALSEGPSVRVGVQACPSLLSCPSSLSVSTATTQGPVTPLRENPSIKPSDAGARIKCTASTKQLKEMEGVDEWPFVRQLGQ